MASRGLSFTGRKLTKHQALAYIQLSEAVQLNDTDISACEICDADFKTSEERPIRFCTRCRHIQGKDCLKTWLKTRHTCPFCRNELCEPEAEDEDNVDDDESLQEELLDMLDDSDSSVDSDDEDIQQGSDVLMNEVEMSDVDSTTAWDTDDEGRPIACTDDSANLEMMKTMASIECTQDVLDMLHRRGLLFQADELVAAGHNEYATYDRQNVTFGLALPNGRYEINAAHIILGLRLQYIGTLFRYLRAEDAQLHVAAHPLAWIAYKIILSTVVEGWAIAPAQGGLPFVGYPQATAEELERSIRIRFNQNPLLVNLRTKCMPGGKYPPTLILFVADMVERVLETAVGEAGWRDYQEGKHTAPGSRRPW